VTISVGAASWSPAMSASELYAAADAAMYRAKEAGRNRTAVAPDAPLRGKPSGGSTAAGLLDGPG
jgi:hypothetical protein